MFKCPFCEKKYKHHPSLSRHKKNCPENEKEQITIPKQKLRDLIIFAREMEKENKALRQRISELGGESPPVAVNSDVGGQISHTLKK